MKVLINWTEKNWQWYEDVQAIKTVAQIHGLNIISISEGVQIPFNSGSKLNWPSSIEIFDISLKLKCRLEKYLQDNYVIFACKENGKGHYDLDLWLKEQSK